MTDEEYEEDFVPSSPKKSYPTVDFVTLEAKWSSIPRSGTPSLAMPSACAALEQLSQAVHVGFTSSHSLLVSPSPGAVKSFKSLSTSAGTPRVRGNILLRSSPLGLEDPLTLQDEEAAAAATGTQGDVGEEMMRRRSALKSRPTGKKFISVTDGADIKGPPTSMVVNNNFSSKEADSKRRGREIHFETRDTSQGGGRERRVKEEEEYEEIGEEGKTHINHENENDEWISPKVRENFDPTLSRTSSSRDSDDVQENTTNTTNTTRSSSSSFREQQARRARLATSLLRNKISDVPQVPATSTLRPLSSSSSSTMKRSSMKGGRSRSQVEQETEGGGGDVMREDFLNHQHSHPHSHHHQHHHQQPRIASFNEAMRSKTYSYNTNLSSSSSSSSVSGANGHGVGLAPPTFNPLPPYGFGGTVDGSIINRFSSSSTSSNGASLFFSGSAPLPVVLVGGSGRGGGGEETGKSGVASRTMYLWDHPPPGMTSLSTPGGGSPSRDDLSSYTSTPSYLHRRPSLSDDVLLQLFLLSHYKGQTKEEQRIDEMKRKAARESGLVVTAPHVPLAVLSNGANSAKSFANSLKNEQAVLLLKHGSGGGGGEEGGESSHSKSTTTTPSSSLDAPVNPGVLAALWGGVFDRLFSHVVINLPRLVAEASLSCSAAVNDNKQENENDEGEGRNKKSSLSAMTTHTTPLPLPLSLAVGHPILTSLQDMLTDVDVLTLVREAVAAKIQQRLSNQLSPPLSINNPAAAAAETSSTTTTTIKETVIPEVVST